MLIYLGASVLLSLVALNYLWPIASPNLRAGDAMSEATAVMITATALSLLANTRNSARVLLTGAAGEQGDAQQGCQQSSQHSRTRISHGNGMLAETFVKRTLARAVERLQGKTTA